MDVPGLAQRPHSVKATRLVTTGRARARAEAPLAGPDIRRAGCGVLPVYRRLRECASCIQVVGIAEIEGTGQPATSERAIWFRGSFHGSDARGVAGRRQVAYQGRAVVVSKGPLQDGASCTGRLNA